MAADKYADLAPKRNRSCWTVNGLRKRMLTQFQAEKYADQQTEAGTPTKAYRCPDCDWWHNAHEAP